MMIAKNVIPMPDQVGDRQFLAQARLLGDLLHSCAAEALARIQAAEHQGIERLNEYTPQDRLLTLKEAAAYLGFKPRTLQSWSTGTHPTLPYVLLGGEKRFRKSSLDRRLTELEVRPRVIKL